MQGLCVAQGCSVRFRTETLSGWSLAARWGAVDCARVLLEHGANPRARNGTGRTALHAACFGTGFHGHQVTGFARKEHERQLLECVNLLLAWSADVNALENRGRTALHDAVEAKRPAIVAMLLAKRADVNARDHNNDTPLHLVANTSERLVGAPVEAPA